MTGAKNAAVGTIDRFRRELFEVIAQGTPEAMQAFIDRTDPNTIAQAGIALVEFIESRISLMKGDPVVEIIEAMWHHLQGTGAMQTLSTIAEQLVQAEAPVVVEGPSPFDSSDAILRK